ncbi:target of Myb1 membrane trafficking protein [Aulostomus maculatus]
MFSLGEKIEFLMGNAFATPVGQRIERATSGFREFEDWGLNMEICDIINETDEGPRDAVKAVKKRIVGNKNVREIMLALTVLETCVKNCGHRFHILVASQEFVEGVLVRSILPKYNPPTALHDKVLSLIQSWADAFRSSPSLAGVVYVYDDLRTRGLEFPMTDLDALSPIHTPHRSIPDSKTLEMTPTPESKALEMTPIPESKTLEMTPTPESKTLEMSPDSPHQSQPQAPSNPPTQNTPPPAQPSDRAVSLSPEQEEKLRGDLALVKGNLSVMCEMLNELKPGQSQRDDTELLQQLYVACKSMQTRVVELIPQLVDEGFIEELLMVNDDLNNTFIRYERFDRFNKAQDTTPQRQSPVSSPSLINLSPEPSVFSQPAVITTSQSVISAWANQRHSANHKEEEQFDMFAQTRGCSLAEQRKSVKYEDPRAVEGLAGALDTRLQVTGGRLPVTNSVPSDIDKWLSCDMEDQMAVSEGVSSEEFDKFLEERAKVADQSSQMVPSTRLPPLQSTRQQDTSHDQLFSL